MNVDELQVQLERAQTLIGSLQEELAETNLGLVALSLELEKRVEERTAALTEAQVELERANAELMQLARELDDRVAQRTAQLQAQSETLRRQANLLDLVHDSIAVRDLAGRILYWNRGSQETYGWEFEEVNGKCAFDLVEAVLPQPLDEIMAHLLQNGFWEGEVVHCRKDGRKLNVASRWRLMHDEEGRPSTVLVTNNDVTERRRAEDALREKNEELREVSQQLWQTAKLATMGELAATIAHELNNPLGTISLGIEELLSQTSPDSPARRELLVMEQETDRMAGLVGNLLQFCRPGHQQISTFAVTDEIDRTLELSTFLLRKRNVSVVRENGPNLPMIQGDRQKLRQVFLNLIVNASDAMPQGGTLTIRTSVGALQGEPAIVMEFADTGVGIPPENLERIMDAFFTTKEEGRGTGLGLAICRRIVQEHHGAIQVFSKVGEGTSVRVCLPIRNGGSVDHLDDE